MSENIYKQVIKQKTGLVGLILIAILLVMAIISVIVYYPQYYDKWNNYAAWSLYPSTAAPSWISFFSSQKLPYYENITPSVNNEGIFTNYTFKYYFNYDLPPKGLIIKYSMNFSSPPVIAIILQRPDNNDLELFSGIASQSGSLDVFNDPGVISTIQSFVSQKTGQIPQGFTPSYALFQEVNNNMGTTKGNLLIGQYKIIIEIAGGQNVKVNQVNTYVIGYYYGLMGTDYFGRPIDLGLILGLPNALLIGFLVALFSVLVGIVYGAISGYVGGKIDDIMQWLLLLILALPALPFLIVLIVIYRPDILLESLLIAFLSWPAVGVVARSISLSLRSAGYIEAARALGVREVRIFFKHVFPRLLPLTMALMALTVPAGVILSQTLAFLGLAPLNSISWGLMLDDAYNYQAVLNGWWWWAVFPGIAIVFVAAPFVLLGFTLEKIAAPRISERS